MISSNIQSLARDNVKRLTPYSSARDDFEGEAAVFLDANESPFPDQFNRYPDPLQRQLKAAVSRVKVIDPGNIFIGNGSDEAIDLLIRTFCEPGVDSVLIPQPTYGMYKVVAEINNVAVICPLLTADFDLDSRSILDHALPSTKLIFLCSPNNPSGNLLNASEIQNLLISFKGLVVIDEAYIDFTSFVGWISRLKEFCNLVILQTLSKAWGMAGLRLGLCFADASVIQLLNKIKPPYNINSFTQSEALRKITLSQDEMKEKAGRIIDQRKVLIKTLGEISCIDKIYRSDSNFLLVRVNDSKKVYHELMKHSIIVRDRSKMPLCENCLRITVGTEEENSTLISILRKI